ncbi:gamma carbonic anhydrase family protein [Marichromatium sp. AB31]|nr:gamma carbonic anhydrase family protein [Marichromatium sp. AB31]
MMCPIRVFEGRGPEIDPGAWVDPSAVLIGAVRLAAAASVWPGCVVRGDVERIEIGAASNIQDGCVLHVSHDGPFRPGGAPLLIGERVTVGHQALLHGCEIRERCLIGSGARVLDGALIHPYTLLGAGALVTPGQELAGGQLWLGAPARPVRPLSERERAQIDYSAEHYVALAARHRAALAEIDG